jgi:hypothetical protein
MCKPISGQDTLSNVLFTDVQYNKILFSAFSGCLFAKKSYFYTVLPDHNNGAIKV